MVKSCWHNQQSVEQSLKARAFNQKSKQNTRKATTTTKSDFGDGRAIVKMDKSLG